LLIFLNTSNEAAMAEGGKIGYEKDTKQAVSDPIKGIRSTPHSYPIHSQTYLIQSKLSGFDPLTYPIQTPWIRSTHSLSDPSCLYSIHSLMYPIQHNRIQSFTERLTIFQFVKCAPGVV